MVRKGSSAKTNITRGLFWIRYELETISLEEIIMYPGLLSFLNMMKKTKCFIHVRAPPCKITDQGDSNIFIFFSRLTSSAH